MSRRDADRPARGETVVHRELTPRGVIDAVLEAARIGGALFR